MADLDHERWRVRFDPEASEEAPGRMLYRIGFYLPDVQPDRMNEVVRIERTSTGDTT